MEHVSTKAYWHNGFLYTAQVPHAIIYSGSYSPRFEETDQEKAKFIQQGEEI